MITMPLKQILTTIGALLFVFGTTSCAETEAEKPRHRNSDQQAVSNDQSVRDETQVTIELFTRVARVSRSGDLFELRNEIYTISRNPQAHITGFLKRLWTTKDIDGYNMDKDAIRNPIVKLAIAQALVERGEREHQYISYIKGQIKSTDRAVQTLVAEALRDVGDRESLEHLEVLAESDDKMLAEIAISGLAQNAEYGPYSEEAKVIWDRVQNNKKVDQDLIEKYVHMYSGTDASSMPKFSAGLHYSGDIISEDVVKHIHLGEYDKVEALLLPKANSMDPQAQNLLGEVYLSMTPPRYDDAAKWFLMSAELDYAPAKVNLASLHFSGDGVDRNRHKAMALLKEAGKQGDKHANEILEEIKARRNN